MTTMLEKLIEAIMDSGPVGCCTIAEREAKEIARAALQAIRVPIDAMINAAWLKADIDDAVTPEESWPAMIDAILEEKPE